MWRQRRGSWWISVWLLLWNQLRCRLRIEQPEIVSRPCALGRTSKIGWAAINLSCKPVEAAWQDTGWSNVESGPHGVICVIREHGMLPGGPQWFARHFSCWCRRFQRGNRRLKRIGPAPHANLRLISVRQHCRQRNCHAGVVLKRLCVARRTSANTLQRDKELVAVRAVERDRVVGQPFADIGVARDL